MTNDAFFSALAALNAEYWWARAALTLAAIWLFIDLARRAPWAQVGLKVALAATCVTVGVLFYGVFLPGSLPPDVPRLYGVWLHRIGSVAFVVAGIVGLADAARDGTSLVLPERGWRLGVVLAAAVLGLGFPAFELLMGHIYPEAQAFGVAPAPIVVALLPLLGASRLTGAAGRVWFWLMVLPALELGILAPLFGLPHAQPVALLAVAAGVVMRLRGQPSDVTGA